jgi:hypothetical protein
MSKNNILAAVLLLVVVGSAMAVRSSSSAQAQATGAHRWEYCAITGINTRWRSEPEHQIDSFAVITYFGTTSGRTEEVGGEAVSNPDAAQAATFRAIAKLGAEGWEVVGNENINLDSNPEHVGGLLFKRPR